MTQSYLPMTLLAEMRGRKEPGPLDRGPANETATGDIR